MAVGKMRNCGMRKVKCGMETVEDGVEYAFVIYVSQVIFLKVQN